ATTEAAGSAYAARSPGPESTGEPAGAASVPSGCFKTGQADAAPFAPSGTVGTASTGVAAETGCDYSTDNGDEAERPLSFGDRFEQRSAHCLAGVAVLNHSTRTAPPDRSA